MAVVNVKFVNTDLAVTSLETRVGEVTLKV